MQSKILVAAASLSLAYASVSAQAMPAGSVDAASAAPHITLAAEGCGPEMAVAPSGRCRRMRRPVVVAPVVRRPVVIAPVVRGPVVVRHPVRPKCGVRVGPIGVRTPC